MQQLAAKSISLHCYYRVDISPGRRVLIRDDRRLAAIGLPDIPHPSSHGAKLLKLTGIWGARNSAEHFSAKTPFDVQAGKKEIRQDGQTLLRRLEALARPCTHVFINCQYVIPKLYVMAYNAKTVGSYTQWPFVVRGYLLRCCEVVQRWWVSASRGLYCWEISGSCLLSWEALLTMPFLCPGVRACRQTSLQNFLFVC